MDEGHWTETFESDSITDENREAFNTANSKYATMNDAVVGGYNAQQAVGKPFKVPEDMAKLPDDQSRADFKSQARRALGINIPKDLDSLKDVDFKAGLAEGAAYDENFVGVIKNWAVENGIDTATLSKMASLYNGPLQEYSAKAIQERDDAKFAENAKATNEGLVKHFGSQEKVDSESELLKRAIRNHPGITPETSEKVADIVVDVLQKGGSDAAVVLLEMIAPMAREGSSHVGDGSGGGGEVKQLSPYEAKKARWPETSGEWGKETDQWENETLNTKKALGYKIK